MNNLQLRIVSGVVLAAAVLVLTWLGGVWFRLFAVLLGFAIFYEWTRMAGVRAPHIFGVAALMAAALVMFLTAQPLWLVLLVVALAPLVSLVSPDGIALGAWPSTGVAYASLSAISLGSLRGDDHAGLAAILYLFAVVWTTDILAYFVGRAVGGPKLAPSISPGKTQSGAVGGAIGGVVGGALVAAATGGDVLMLAALALVISVAAQAGDLFESWVKRRHGAKDSSNLIPGHGGVMDRVDGLVVAAFLLFVAGALAADPVNPQRGFFPG